MSLSHPVNKLGQDGGVIQGIREGCIRIKGILIEKGCLDVRHVSTYPPIPSPPKITYTSTQIGPRAPDYVQP